jgi:hypothetical protein
MESVSEGEPEGLAQEGLAQEELEPAPVKLEQSQEWGPGKLEQATGPVWEEPEPGRALGGSPWKRVPFYPNSGSFGRLTATGLFLLSASLRERGRHRLSAVEKSHLNTPREPISFLNN